MVIPASAWLAERWGLRRIYLASPALFATLSLLGSQAWDLDSLVLLRALQAVPGAVVPVVSAALLSRLVPPSHRMMALSWYGLCIVAATGFSSLIGGFLLDDFHTWRSIFYLDAPVAVVIALATLIVVPDLPGRRGPRFDLLGYLTVATGLSTLLVAVSQGTQWGWTSFPVLILVPQAVVWRVMLPLSRRIFMRFGARGPAALGMALVGVCSLLLSRITDDTGRPDLVVWLCVRAFGIGLALLPMLATANRSVPPAVVNQATALRTLVQRIVAVFGSTGIAALVSRSQAQMMADRSGLLGADVATSPLLAHEGPGAVTALWTQTQHQVATQSYADI